MSQSNVKINKDFKLGEDYTHSQKLEQDESRMQDRPKVGVPIFNPQGGNTTMVPVPGPPGPRGEKGEKGEVGETGPRGYTGEQGEKGEQGVSVVGETGPQGESGKSIEFAFDYTNGVRLMIRQVGTAEWTYSEDLTGDIGPQGIQGETGAPGEKGEVGETGSGGSEGGIVITQELVDIMNCFSIDGNGNLVCSKKLGITKSVAAGDLESFAVNGYINATDFESGASVSVQEVTSRIIFDVSPENIMVLEDANAIQRSLAAVFTAYQDNTDLSLSYETNFDNVSEGLVVEQVGFEFVVISMTGIDVGSFDIVITTTGGIFVGKRRVNVYKLLIA